MKTTTSFKSQQSNEIWNIIYNVHCKGECAIYLIECTLCNLQYVGKHEILFNIRLKNNHRKDVNDPKAILADKHFQKSGPRSNEHARFTIIDRLTKKP